MRVINVHEAKTHLSKYLDQVKDGEELIIGKNGKPYARLVPFESGKRPLGFLKTAFSNEGLKKLEKVLMEPSSEETIKAWEGSSEVE